MTGKIDRQPAAPRPTLQRAATPEPVAKPVAPQTLKGAPGTAFSTSAPATTAVPDGAHVSTSAQPDALWGGGAKSNSDDPAAIAAMNPADRAAKLAEINARRDETQAKILARCNELEKKWEAAPAATKEAALRQYLQASRRLDPETRRALVGKLDHADVAHQKIDGLLKKREGLPPSRHASPEMKLKRAELAKELKAARRQEKSDVKAATKVVDDAGLKVDRLAVTEQAIDPNAPKPGSDGSLLGMVTSFLHLSWLSNFVMLLSTTVQAAKQTIAKREHEELLVQEVKTQDAKHLERLKELSKSL